MLLNLVKYLYDNKCSTNLPIAFRVHYVLATCKSFCNRIAGTSNALRHLAVFISFDCKSCSAEPMVYGCQHFTRVDLLGNIS